MSDLSDLEALETRLYWPDPSGPDRRGKSANGRAARARMAAKSTINARIAMSLAKMEARPVSIRRFSWEAGQ